MTERGATDLSWWRGHVTYAVDQRRQMRTAYALSAALMIVAVASVIPTAAHYSWWLAVPVAEFAAVFLAIDAREWIKSERNYARSLRVRRAGLAEAKNHAAAES